MGEILLEMDRKQDEKGCHILESLKIGEENTI